jgi:hypothetical protein
MTIISPLSTQNTNGTNKINLNLLCKPSKCSTFDNLLEETRKITIGGSSIMLIIKKFRIYTHEMMVGSRMFKMSAMT